MSDSTEIRARLLRAIAARDADAFEHAVADAFQAEVLDAVSDIFTEAILMPWHSRHEDLASALQRTKYPRAVEALFQAAHSRHDYLDYDEFFGFARKCTWALADIGTPEAKERLRDLAQSGNATIAGYAQKRLDRWDAEIPRKGA
jgi:hypothetical protein